MVPLAVTVQVRVWLEAAFESSASVAVTTTEYGLYKWSPLETVPLMIPVDESMLNPAGKFVAEYVNGLPTESRAASGR